jgi:hypothetical protein
LVWVKQRNVVNYHGLSNSVSGVNKALFCNVTDAESTASSNYVTSFDTNGFSINQGGVFNGSSGTTMVAWQWKAGGAAVTNTAGTISSQVSANTTSGFSVVSFTGTGAAATVGHGLGVAPSMIIIKCRPQVTDWPVYHISIGATNYLNLNETRASTANSAPWNNTAPTSSVFTVGTSFGTNYPSNTLIAYCWAPIAGYSAFGSYTGNGSADGPFVYTGFRPKYVMWKRTYSVNDWYIIDTSRSPYNNATNPLAANLSSDEGSLGTNIDFLSNGFKPRQTGGHINASGGTYIYMAFAENPFKYANAR